MDLYVVKHKIYDDVGNDNCLGIVNECSMMAGQLLYCDGSLFMSTGDTYVKISNEFQTTSKNEHSHLPTNCKNCGAPLHGHICEFCDTEYN